MRHGDAGDLSTDLNVLEQIEILLRVVIKVSEIGTESVETMSRVRVLRQGLNIGFDAV